ncbi:MAG: DUF7594 domain-containing protein [Planctomycetota bacterium]
MCDRTGLCSLAAALAAALALLAGSPAAADVVLIEENGIVVGETENYSTRTADGSGNNWLVVPIESPGAGPSKVAGARGFQYVQSLPDNGSDRGPTVPPSIEYPILIQNPGTYQLYLSWETNKAVGGGGNADSIFVDIAELKGGGVADWYELTENDDGDFATNRWDGGGQAEVNQAGAANNPITWDLATPGLYTLRISQREDGSAADAFVLQHSGLPAPAGFGPSPSLIAVTPSEDSYVRLGQSGTNFGDADQVVVKDSGGGGTTRKGYLQYDLSTVNTPLADAMLALTVSMNNSGGGNPAPSNFLVQVFGLNDGLPAEGWDEDTIDWDNAPANASANNFTADATFLGEFEVTDQDDVGSLVTFSNQQLLDFVDADTDGLLTLMLRREGGNSSNNLGFASTEHDLLQPVSLVLAPNIPEPTTLALLGLGALGLWRRRRS